MHIEEQIERSSESNGNTSRRFSVFVLSFVVAFTVFLFFTALMMSVPGVLVSSKMKMLTISVIGAGISLVIGIWKFESTDAPITHYPVGPILCIILFLELGVCIFNLIDMYLHPSHYI